MSSFFDETIAAYAYDNLNVNKVKYAEALYLIFVYFVLTSYKSICMHGDIESGLLSWS